MDIIFEDDCLVVVNKPPGLLVVPTPAGEKNTLTNLLGSQLRERGEKVTVHPCHRLDRDTSGLILYAKSKEIQEKMLDAFKRHEIKKTYIAFVHGQPGRQKAVIDQRIEGVSAITNYEVIDKKDGYSVVKVQPVTGRTNQIRIHFKKIGHPLVGDRKFAFARDFKLKFRRTALHAKELSFRHPITGKWLSFSIDLPRDMRDF